MQGLGIGCGLESTVLIQGPGEELPSAWLRERPFWKAEELISCLCASHTHHTLPPHTCTQWLSEAGLLAGWPATRPKDMYTAGLALVIETGPRAVLEASAPARSPDDKSLRQLNCDCKNIPDHLAKSPGSGEIS